MRGFIKILDSRGNVVREFAEWTESTRICFGHLPRGVDYRDEMNRLTQIANDVRIATGHAEKNVPLPFPERIEPLDYLIDPILYKVVYNGKVIKRNSPNRSGIGIAKKQSKRQQ